MELSKLEILQWLRENRSARLRMLYEQADSVRREYVGDAVHLRGLIEVSSYCVRQCMYCGLRRGNSDLPRYRMTRVEILECARQAETLGYGTVVMQAGEDDALTAEWIAEIVRWIKRETTLAVTLSLGERREDELRVWRKAGADRYLLRFETSDPKLFRLIHPSPRTAALSRLPLLEQLKVMGYEAGGGVMVGIPGQSFESLAQDVLTFRALDLDMIGIGPYIAHPSTPLGAGALRPDIAAADQVPASEEMVYKMIALARIMCPTANIPSTSALATINNGRRTQKGTVGRGQRGHAEPDSAEVPQPVSDLSRKGLYRRECDGLQSVPPRTDSLPRPSSCTWLRGQRRVRGVRSTVNSAWGVCATADPAW
jgi:biotin synthase